ncbi:MAG: hypothetical protein ABI355_19935 [Solirubrobacteraceae bacterium]
MLDLPGRDAQLVGLGGAGIAGAGRTGLSRARLLTKRTRERVSFGPAAIARRRADQIDNVSFSLLAHPETRSAGF